MPNLMIFSGSANPTLASKIAKNLQTPLGNMKVGRFSDGEADIEVQENVRGRDVFIIQPTSMPANEHIMELIIMADALRRASASRITAVIPYYGYARQDRRIRSSRVPISAKVIADMLTSVGINRILTVDIHAEQIQGFFHIPVDNVYGSPVLLDYIRAKNLDKMVVVSPDVGGVTRARALAKRLNNAELAIIDKRRPKPNESRVMNLIGAVEGRHCLLIDDIIDTAGTLCKAGEALLEHGAASVSAYCTHPVLSGNAIENIMNSSLDEVVVTNSIPLKPEAEACKKIIQLDLSPMLSESIRRVSCEQSISSMFEE